MPATARPNRTPHPRLKKLRKFCVLTQEALAKKVGTSVATIVAIETGTLSMSRSLADRIMMATGVDSTSLLDGPILKSLVRNEPYAESDYKAHFGFSEFVSPNEHISAIEGGTLRPTKMRHVQLVKELEEEIAAVSLSSLKSNQFYVFRYLWRSWRDETVKALKLTDSIDALAGEHGLKFKGGKPVVTVNEPARRVATGGGRKAKKS